MILRDAPIEIETAASPTSAVIWLHGLGADGHDFAGILPELGLSRELAVRFVFPHAPMRPVTINNGYVMRAWYDLGFSSHGFMQNAAHIAESVAAIHELTEREVQRGIDTAKVVLAGFSQGGAIALQSALRAPNRLAGAVILSAPAPYFDDLLREATPANRQLPVFLAHGVYDPVVPYSQSEMAHAGLKACGWPVEWRNYPIEHSVNLEEIRDIGRFLSKVLD